MMYKLRELLLIFGIWSSLFQAGAQTLTITNGVQKYASLTTTTVAMSGRCELWLTNSTAPLSGCTVNLNSIDSWLFLPGVKPSAVVSTYLGQIAVNGVAAVADSNVRVVQYGQYGAVVIPYPSSFRPLTVFTGAEFTGAASTFAPWVYSTGAGISNIRSFKLKRGYQVVFGQSADGKNNSKCYVAQDGDLEVGILPTTLDKQVQFIYVTPWRWTGKKGIAGDPGLGWFNVNWWYNWNINSSSTRDLEYLALRQTQYWPSMSQNWQSLGINTVFGYNEPDSASQANLTVSQAIASWGDLLGTGLRVGSPSTTDGGPNSWLIPFISQADAAGLRVDFACTHYYQSHNPADPSGCASQMYNFLLNIWNNTHRPIWVTEWNNGANWTDSQWPAPTYAQQQACIQAMVNMLESTPFVERYALYNWVEDTRSLVTSSNTVTPAGTVYSNTVSALSYSQAMPDNGTRGIAEYLFNTNVWDSSGYYNNGLAVGAPAYVPGHTSQAQAIALDGTNSYVQLPANIAKGSAFTFAAWVYWNGGSNWQRIFDFGNDTSHYFFLTPSSGNNTLRFAINNGSGEQIVQRSVPLASGSWQHVAITLNGATAALYVNGAQVAVSNTLSILPSAVSPIYNYLGKSRFAADPLFNGKLEAVEIADFAMTAAQISVLYHSQQNPSYTSGIWTSDADGAWSAGTNWNSGLIANGVSRVADFSAINNTADRTVTLDSNRTVGGLRFGDLVGAQNWFLSGANTLTLDGGAPNMPLIAVNQNKATISLSLFGTNGFLKTGNGTLALSGANTLGGGLTVGAGSLNITGGSTAFGAGTSTIGYLTGTGSLIMSGGSLAVGGECRIGGSDQNGTQYNAAGSATIANATLSVGSLTVARGNYLDNSVSGTVTLNAGGTLISTNDAILKFAGAGLGKLVLNGGNLIVGPAATKWFMVGYWDSGSAELDVNSGNLLLENGSSVKMIRGNNNSGTNVINQAGGAVTFYGDAGSTPGGSGSLDLNYAGGTNSTSAYNLNGGTLAVPQILASLGTGSHAFNFNGGTLKPTADAPAFLQGLTAANIRNGGAFIDSGGFNVAIAQPLVHSTIAGDNATDGGLAKLGAGTLTLSATNSYRGATAVNGGTLLVNGSLGVGSVTVASGGTLAGHGVIGGALTVQSGGTLAPGGGFTILAASSSVNLQSGSMTVLSISTSARTNDKLQVAGALNLGGTLVVSNLAGTLALGDSFTLFQAPSVTGNFDSFSLPALAPGLGWNTAALSQGVLSVLSTAPVAVASTVGATNLSFAWPADHTGWRLVMDTNGLANPLWFTVPGSMYTNQIQVPFDPAQMSVFFQLVYP
jgi:autotransporter-associated beta strand protein